MTDQTAPHTGNPFDPRTVAVFLLVAILAFGAWVTLMAWSPELTKRDVAGPHPYARSATGYGGLISLLRAQDIPVSISRVSRTLESEDRGLLVLTVEPYGMGRRLEDTLIGEPALVVLPKWLAPPDRQKPEWSGDMQRLPPDQVDLALHIFEEDARIKQVAAPNFLSTPQGRYQPVFIERIQLIHSKQLEPVISTQRGLLLAKLPGQEIYILSDPDLVNTLGLAEFENARLATDIINRLRRTADTPVVFDATLHGFERSESLLKLALDVPYIGATLIALAALGLLGWGALVRFGSPDREGRAIALGKEALADSSAGLIAMARRETHMAPGYLSLTRRLTAKAVGAPAGTSDSDLAGMFDRMSKAGELAASWSDLKPYFENDKTSRDELLDKAYALWLWRQEITHGTK